MRNTEARLKYQQESGMGLAHISKIVNDRSTVAHCNCPECGEIFEEGAVIDEELMEYIQWLENQLSSWILADQLAKDIQKVVKG